MVKQGLYLMHGLQHGSRSHRNENKTEFDKFDQHPFHGTSYPLRRHVNKGFAPSGDAKR